MSWTVDGRLAASRSRGHLPHLELRGSTYFVTFRAADAVTPRDPDADVADVRQPEAVLEHCEPPLRAGRCVLARPELGGFVALALRHFDGERYRLGSWCVMPNHVHVLVTPLGDHRLPRIVQSWKSFSARQINRTLGQSGRFWEREYFDHLVRSDRTLDTFVQYIEWNPVTAGLCRRPEEWPLGSAFGVRDP